MSTHYNTLIYCIVLHLKLFFVKAKNTLTPVGKKCLIGFLKLASPSQIRILIITRIRIVLYTPILKLGNT